MIRNQYEFPDFNSVLQLLHAQVSASVSFSVKEQFFSAPPRALLIYAMTFPSCFDTAPSS